MTLDEAIAKLEDSSTHALICENGELTAWLRELRDARELIRRQCEYIDAYIDCDMNRRCSS